MQGFNNDMGLDFLMNPKKKLGSDAISISSHSSHRSHRSHRSTRSHRSHRSHASGGGMEPQIIDINLNDNAFDVDASEGNSEISADIDNIVADSDAGSVVSASSSSDNSKLESIKFNYKKPTNSAPKVSEDELLNMKKELLYQFDRMEKKGMKLPKKFTLSSNFDEMKSEYDRLKRDREVDATVKLYRRIMMIGCSGLEWVNNKYNPIGVKLSGWSDSVYENIDDYDDIFEELHDKYKSKTKMSPEMRLLMMLGGSAFMHHMTHSMFKDQLPGLDEILKQNPDLAKNLAAATSEHMAKQQQGAGNLFGSLGSMFSGLFGGGGGGGGGMGAMMGNMMGNMMNGMNMPPQQPQSQDAFKPRVNMKGPSNVDELLKEFENDRIEMMSTITESELAELAADDVSSINGLVMKKGGAKKSNKKITLEI
jgi:hypothetical protein